jgi:hypothetical protein
MGCLLGCPIYYHEQGLKKQITKIDTCYLCFNEQIKIVKNKNCTHFYCESCIDRWNYVQIYKMKRKITTCPLCNAPT